MNRTQIENALREALERDGRIRWAYAFGSFVRGGSFRDLDVAVMPIESADLTLLELGRLRLQLSRVCDTEVDLVDLRQAPLVLLASILRERSLLVDHAPEDRHAWEATMGSRWLDFAPALHRQSELRREAMRERRKALG
jgi:predicted nucleotidyltransferase